MNKNAPTKSTPSPTTSKVQNSTETVSPGKEFLMANLSMSWKLAIVVMVPIVGGFKLDEKLGWTPTLTILGFVLAMAGTAFVLWQVSQQVSQISLPPSKKETK
jgi:hypothetical protein